MSLKVQEVFTVSGVPTHTFVKPSGYSRLSVALATPGRGVIIEGPSGIGKSTAVTKALQELGLAGNVTMLSARNTGDVEYIGMLPEIRDFGTVVIDDFHRLEDAAKRAISDLLKIAADQQDPKRKLVIIGINEAGRSLIDSSSHDVANRIEVVKFESEPASRIEALIAAGEQALNISIAAKSLIVTNSAGSFYIAQLLCWNACVEADVLEGADALQQVPTPYATVQRRVVERQRDRFGDAVRNFARGTKFRPGGRAPYLHILRWLSESETWGIHVLDEMRKHPSEKASVGQVRDKGYLANLCELPAISKVLHFDPNTNILSVEDPMLVYYLRSISWPEFIREVGFTKVDYDESYDVALSFAGEDRRYAENLRDALEDFGHLVFYDMTEQHLMLGQRVEDYLAPIYESGSRYVVAILGIQYGRKRWTLFEADHYKDRLDAGEVIPIWAKGMPPAPFDRMRELGGLEFEPSGDLLGQAKEHAAIISQRLGSDLLS